MSLRIYDRLFKKSDKPNMIPSWNNASVKQWMVVSLMALILWVVSCQRGYSQIVTANPGEYTILATGNALINNTVKSETKAERETAVMQNAMAGEFTKMAEWERQYNSYLKMANGYASAIKAATHIYDDGVRILLTLNKLRQAATNNPQGIVATLDMNNLYMETVTEMVSVFTLLLPRVASRICLPALSALRPSGNWRISSRHFPISFNCSTSASVITGWQMSGIVLRQV